MRTILSVLLLCILIGNSFSQGKRNYQISSSRTESSDNGNSLIYRTYFLVEKSADSSIFSRDSIVLSNEKIGGQGSLNLYTDSKFILEYSNGLDTIYTKDEKTGELIILVVEKNSETTGRYGIMRKQCSENEETKDILLTLWFKNGRSINYLILDEGANTLLVKTK